MQVTSKIEAAVEAVSTSAPAEAVPQLSAFQELRARRAQERVQEQAAYQVAAIAASLGILGLATFAVSYRIIWHLQEGAGFPVEEMAGTLFLTLGGMVSVQISRACTPPAGIPAIPVLGDASGTSARSTKSPLLSFKSSRSPLVTVSLSADRHGDVRSLGAQGAVARL